jgi:hypothetical protein
MRKILVVAMAALLVVAFAVSSFPAETTFSGNYRVRSVMEWGYGIKGPSAGGPITDDDALYTAYFDQRFRLTITHTRSEFLKAVVTLDLVEDVWGQGRAMYIAGNNSGEIITEAYIEALTPIGLFTLGAKDGKFGYGTWSDSGGDSNNTSISWAVKFDKIVAALVYTKYRDYCQDFMNYVTYMPTHPLGMSPTGGTLSENYDQDLDSLVLSVFYLGDQLKAGLLFQYIVDPHTVAGGMLIKHGAGFANYTFESAHGPTVGTNPFCAMTGYLGWPTPLGGGGPWGLGRAGMYRTNAFVLAGFWNLQLFDGALEFKGEVDYIWGTPDINGQGDAYNAWLVGAYPAPLSVGPAVYYTPGVDVLPDSLKISTLNMYFDLAYHHDLFTVGVAFLYGSGVDKYKGLRQKEFALNNTGLGDFHWGNVIVPGDQGLLGGQGNDPFLASPLGLGSTQENVMSVKLYWSVCPFDKLDIHGAFIWAKYVEEVGRGAVDAAGTPLEVSTGVYRVPPYYGHPMNYMDMFLGGLYVPTGYSDDLGWEIDIGVTYEIMEGLSFNSEFGILFTGDAFDYRALGLGGGPSKDFPNIYRWVNTLTYEF